MSPVLPLVSILIPSYNREKYIEATIRSALNQTYKHIEVIVVDNASTDSTWKKILDLSLEDERVKAFQNEVNIGPVRNWQRCVDEASGHYVKILWSDDLMTTDAVEKLVIPFLDKESEVAFSLSSVEFVDMYGEKCNSIAYELAENDVLFDSKDYLRSLMLAENNYPVSPGCALFRLSDVKSNLLLTIPSVQEYDFANIAIGNDLYLFLKIAKNYSKVAYVNKPVNLFREHDGSISLSSKKNKLVFFYHLFRCDFYSQCNELFDAEFSKEFFLTTWFFIYRYRFKEYNVNSYSDLFSCEVNIPSITIVDKFLYLKNKFLNRLF